MTARPLTFQWMLLGRLSRLLKKRRSQEGAKAVVQGASKPRSRSQSPVYLPTGVLKQTPTDDWSDWSSFTLELEVHPPSSSALDVGSAGRRTASHQCEALLGFTPGSTQSAEWHGQAPLRQRVIVERLVPGGPLHQGFAHVQPGDPSLSLSLSFYFPLHCWCGLVAVFNPMDPNFCFPFVFFVSFQGIGWRSSTGGT